IPVAASSSSLVSRSVSSIGALSGLTTSAGCRSKVTTALAHDRSAATARSLPADPPSGRLKPARSSTTIMGGEATAPLPTDRTCRGDTARSVRQDDGGGETTVVAPLVHREQRARRVEDAPRPDAVPGHGFGREPAPVRDVPRADVVEDQ